MVEPIGLCKRYNGAQLMSRRPLMGECAGRACRYGMAAEAWLQFVMISEKSVTAVPLPQNKHQAVRQKTCKPPDRPA